MKLSDILAIITALGVLATTIGTVIVTVRSGRIATRVEEQHVMLNSAKEKADQLAEDMRMTISQAGLPPVPDRSLKPLGGNDDG